MSTNTGNCWIDHTLVRITNQCVNVSSTMIIQNLSGRVTARRDTVVVSINYVVDLPIPYIQSSFAFYPSQIQCATWYMSVSRNFYVKQSEYHISTIYSWSVHALSKPLLALRKTITLQHQGPFAYGTRTSIHESLNITCTITAIQTSLTLYN